MLQDLYFSEAAAAAGMTTVAAYQLWSQPHENPVWRDVVPHFRHLSSQELQPFDKAGAVRMHRYMYLYSVLDQYYSWTLRKGPEVILQPS